MNLSVLRTSVSRLEKKHASLMLLRRELLKATADIAIVESEIQESDLRQPAGTWDRGNRQVRTYLREERSSRLGRLYERFTELRESYGRDISEVQKLNRRVWENLVERQASPSQLESFSKINVQIETHTKQMNELGYFSLKFLERS